MAVLLVLSICANLGVNTWIINIIEKRNPRAQQWLESHRPTQYFFLALSICSADFIAVLACNCQIIKFELDAPFEPRDYAHILGD